MTTVISLRSVAAQLPEYWAPRVVGEIDDSYVKVAKVVGSLAWHCHAQEDEMFVVLRGQLRIELDAGAVEIREGEMFIVPKGVRHNPVAEHECHILLIERKSTAHTGDVITEKTKSIEEQLHGFASQGSSE